MDRDLPTVQGLDDSRETQLSEAQSAAQDSNLHTQPMAHCFEAVRFVHQMANMQRNLAVHLKNRLHP